MQNLSFRLIQPYDISILQAMIQESDFSDLRFNHYGPPIFVALCHGHIAGFTFGQKGYGENSDVLTISGTYFRAAYDDENHDHELHLAFIHWAEKSLQVSRYQLGEYAEIKPIHISFSLPPQYAQILPPPTPQYLEPAYT